MKANLELAKISEWFGVNKLSLNKDKTKTKFILFHRPQDRGNLPLQLPALKLIVMKQNNHLQLNFLEL